MTVHPIPLPGSAPEHAHLHATCAFVAQHGEALARAAELVADRREGARARALAAAVRRATRLDRPLRGEMKRLHRLLGLKLHPAHGAGLHPADPRVHALCRLTDALGDLLAATAPAPTRAPAGAEPSPVALPAWASGFRALPGGRGAAPGAGVATPPPPAGSRERPQGRSRLSRA